jgi:transglutaminase-like putative cysteine protease/sugar lactone lactonase YvrE
MNIIRCAICLALVAFVALPVLWATPGDTLRSFPTPGNCPTGLAYDGQYLWLVDRLSDSLYAISPISGEVNKSLPAPGFIPLGLAWDGEYLWGIDGEENRIWQLDTESGITVRSFSSPTPKPQGLAWDGHSLWLADDQEDLIAKISTDDGTTIVSFRAPSTSPQGLTWDGKYLWCADRVQDRIFMIEPTDGEVLLSLDAPGKYARGLAWRDGKLWNVDYQDDRLYELAVNDGALFKISNAKTEKLLVTHEFRNYGPGEVQTLDVYLALPRDRPGQKIHGKVLLNPQPTETIQDRWGQEIAHYRLANPPRAQRDRVTMVVTAQLSDVRWFVFPEKVGSLEDIDKDIRQKYLVDEEKYCIHDPTIVQAAKEAVGDEKRPYWLMRKIYKYVRDHMFYELSGGWNVAPAVLKRGNGSCSEYSFVFIALCRAAGLPTRYVGSVVIRGDDASTDDVFHRWCECYLPGYGWVPVDPSGGDRESPADVAQYFGHVEARFLITTEGGGASEYLGWGYNANEKWTSSGPVKVYVETVGEWSPTSAIFDSSETTPSGVGETCPTSKGTK